MISLSSRYQTPLADEICQLLRKFEGIDPLKRLFWVMLGYDRRDESVLFQASETFRPYVVEGKLFASHDSFHIYYLTLTGNLFHRGLVHRICRYLRSKHRDLAVLFSDVSQSHWQLAYITNDPIAKTHRTRLATMAIGDPDQNPRRQARQLSHLRTYDADDEPLSVLEIISAFDEVFTSIEPVAPHESQVLDDLRFLVGILNRYPLLTRRQEQAIIAELGEISTTLNGKRIPYDQDRTRHRELRDQLVLHNLRLCFMFARHYANGYQEILDLFQEAVLGLHRAAEQVDSDYGTRFSTYASYWIKQSIRRAIMNNGKPIRLPAYMVSLLAKWKRASAVLAERLDRIPTPDEIGRALQLSKRKIGIVTQALRVNRLTRHCEDLQEEGPALFDLLTDESIKAPDAQLMESDYVGRMFESISDMDCREATVIRMRFGLDSYDAMTLREVGENLGLTRERVRQIENLALKHLRCSLESDGPAGK